MKWYLIALLALLPTLACGEELGNMPPDNWGGRHAHLGYSAIMGLTFPELLQSRTWGGVACGGIGVWKEWKDYRKQTPGYRHGLFSRNDLKMDALGCGLGLLGNTGMHVVFGPAGGARLGYSWELK
jgi:hypothetical protein